MIRDICFQQIQNVVEGGWEGKRRFPKLISARADSRSQWALCGPCDIHVKLAAAPGPNARVCLTCSRGLLSSREKQEQPGLRRQFPWINRTGGRGVGKRILEDIKSLKKTGHHWYVHFWETLRSCVTNAIVIWIFYVLISGLSFCCCSLIQRVN